MEGRKRVLIITYYWPPSGGSGVQRWLKFARYLPEYGIDPVIYTPSDPEPDVFDDSLMHDVPSGITVVKQPIGEPGQWLKRWQRRSSGSSAGEAAKPGLIMSWVRGNLFIPDPRVGWVKPSVAFLSGFLQREAIDTVITTGPPHSMHLIGLGLKKKEPGLRWIADFRDPWTTWGALDKFRLGARAQQRHLELEREVVSTADEVVTISPFYVRQFGQRFQRTVRLVTNGFDAEDFRDFRPETTERFVIRHVGIVHPEADLEPFLRVFGNWAQDHPQSELVFTGRVPAALRERVNRDPLLNRCTSFGTTVPHAELMSLYAQSAALLLVLSGYRDAEGFLPGKLFEYLATGLPVISCGPPDGDASALLTACRWPGMSAPSDEAGIRAQLDRAWHDWRSDNRRTPLSAEAMRWSRQALAGTYADLLFSLSKAH